MSDGKEIIPLPKPDIEPAPPGQIQIIEHGRDIHMYKITDTEIDELCSEYVSADFGLFTLCAGILVAFIIALLTTQMSDRVFATFVAISFASLIGTIFFGLRTLRVKRVVRQRAEQIKASRQV